jgi:hypothetical protein
MLKITSNHLATLKTREIPTLTNPHLLLSNNGCNPPSPQTVFVQPEDILTERSEDIV